MEDAGNHPLSSDHRASITQEVMQAAWGHLKAPDAETALSYFLPNAVVASNGQLFESFEAFSQDTKVFYGTLREVRSAAWIEPHVDVLSRRSAVFTAKVRWESIDNEGELLKLNGVWTALWLLTPNGWRIAVRHESFSGDDDST